MSDPYFRSPSLLADPAAHSFAITKSDSDDLDTTTKSIYVGETGDLVIELTSDEPGSSVTLKSVPVGVLHLRVRKIYSTGSTANSLVGFY